MPGQVAALLPTSRRLGDARGLTALGVVLCAFVLGLTGVVVDVATGTGLRTAFAICFVLGCVTAAAVVHHEDLMAVVVMPPLLFVVLAALASILDRGGGVDSWLTRRVFDVVTTMVTGAPVLLWSVVATLAVSIVRFALYRVSIRRRRGSGPPSRRLSGPRPPNSRPPSPRPPGSRPASA